jgi:hypothetical protein
MRPPNRPLSRIAARNVESVEAEIIQEKAASLGRMSKRLHDALARLEAHDAAPTDDAEDRAALVAAAGEALWYYVIQREAAGLRATEEVLRDFRIPREVYNRMGPAPKRAGEAGGG